MAERKSQNAGNASAAAGRGRARRQQKNAPPPRRTGPWLIGLVLVVIVVMIGFRLRARRDGPQPPSGAASEGIIAKVTSVPASVLDSVGAGVGVSLPAALPDATPPITVEGKPEVLSIGAEFCPYCAAERWALVVALSRFGTFQNVGLTTSAADDVFPSTPTLTFYGSSFTSDVLSFVSVETETNTRTGPGQGYGPLERMTLDQSRLIQTYDVAPYTPYPGSIPFVLVGNKYVISGATYSPEALQGSTWQQIADALSDPANPIAQQVLGAANVITAAICDLTGSQPADVCSSRGVTAGAAALGKR